MRKVTLFIAMSLDGYIADKNGSVDWLAGQEPDYDDMESYHEFIKDIDTVVMGWNTYHQVSTELSPDEWIYRGLTTHVVTHRAMVSTEEIKFTKEDVCSLVTALKQEDGKGIWICGGANIIQPLIRENRIDRYHISVIPTILGSGLPLFPRTASPVGVPADGEIKLKCIKTQLYNGITDLIYEPR